ncbi:hypothetical protein LCGC14_1464720 [marine sediment metagenome]|uniref:Uncharacterized protein n=1 Tax=marine sediment metagenome TaxID=412755 RepID=A0A0F9MFX2_9ZZZZ
MKLLANFEAPSFTRICYHSSEARDYWGKAFKLAGSVCWEAELRTAADGVRACGTCHIPNVGGDRMYEKLARYGLKWRRLTRVGPSAGFSHRRHAPLQEGDPNFSWFTVVSSDDANLDAFEAAHSKSDHNAMGDLLGFPSCCVGGFNEHWPEYCDPIWQAAQATPGVVELPYVGGPYSINNPPDRPVGTLQVRAHPATNNMLRYASARVMFHLTCQLQCPATIDRAEDWVRIMEEITPGGGKATIQLLSLPMAWDVCHGWVKVVTPAFTVHAGSVETQHRYIVQVEPDPWLLPFKYSEIPGRVAGQFWPMMDYTKMSEEESAA